MHNPAGDLLGGEALGTADKTFSQDLHPPCSSEKVAGYTGFLTSTQC